MLDTNFLPQPPCIADFFTNWGDLTLTVLNYMGVVKPQTVSGQTMTALDQTTLGQTFKTNTTHVTTPDRFTIGMNPLDQFAGLPACIKPVDPAVPYVIPVKFLRQMGMDL